MFIEFTNIEQQYIIECAEYDHELYVLESDSGDSFIDKIKKYITSIWNWLKNKFSKIYQVIKSRLTKKYTKLEEEIKKENSEEVKLDKSIKIDIPTINTSISERISFDETMGTKYGRIIIDGGVPSKESIDLKTFKLGDMKIYNYAIGDSTEILRYADDLMSSVNTAINVLSGDGDRELTNNDIKNDELREYVLEGVEFSKAFGRRINVWIGFHNKNLKDVTLREVIKEISALSNSTYKTPPQLESVKRKAESASNSYSKFSTQFKKKQQAVKLITAVPKILQWLITADTSVAKFNLETASMVSNHARKIAAIVRKERAKIRGVKTEIQ